MEETRPKPWPRPFTSRLTERETVLVLVYLPLHLFVLHLVFERLALQGTLSDAMANLLYYGLGFVYMICAAFGFLRRDFDALIDEPLRCLWEVLRGYGLMLCFNLALGLLALWLSGQENPNNESLMVEIEQDTRIMKALLLYLGPLVEEMLFRAGIFGVLRRKNRRAAYIVSALCFSLYHVVPYAAYSPVYWVYLLEYIPVSLLLARCYERSNSIWCSIFFHMLVNGVSLGVLSAL